MTGAELHLPGFVADQPLGFMAALGLLCVLNRTRPHWQTGLGWKQHGYWRARLRLSDDSKGLDDVVEAVWAGLEESKTSVVALTKSADKNLKMSREQLRACLARDSAAGARSILAGLVAELPEEDGVAARSKLQMLNGAGRTDFLPSLHGIATKVTPEHVRKTLRSCAWSYDDAARGGLTLRFDSSADRNHALLPDDPDDMPLTTEFGAERLAVEAFELFPAHPGSTQRSTGFHRLGRKTVLRWPVWIWPLCLDEVQVLLTHPALANPNRHQQTLENLGVEMVMESERVIVGKGKAFLGPAWGYPFG